MPETRAYVVMLTACAAAGMTTVAARGAVLVGMATDGGVVRTFSDTGVLAGAIEPFGGTFRGGVRVAAGDINGDGTPDIITGAAEGNSAHVKVLSGTNGNELRSFLAYPPAFTGGVFVATGDINGDGRADIITGPGDGQGSATQAGGPLVRVFDGVTGDTTSSFLSGPSFLTGGTRVAFSHSSTGAPQIITGAGPRTFAFVTEYAATGTPLGSVLAFDPPFNAGVRVATGDFNHDGFDDIVVGPGPGGGGNIRVFNGVNGDLLSSFIAFGSGFAGGVSVAAGDVNGDGIADIITGALRDSTRAPVAPHVKVFSGADLSLLQSYLAFDADFGGGVEVAYSTIPAPGSGGVLALLGTAWLRRRRITRSGDVAAR